MTTPRTAPSRLATVALLVGSLALSLLIGEGLLRAIDYTYSPLKIEVEGNVHDWRFHHAFGDASFEFDTERIWRPRAGHSVFNDRGYRGRALHGDNDPAVVRILAVGDSNTLGWAGDDGANWPQYTEERLRRAGRPSVVINAGAWGYSSYQGLKHLERMLSLEPDLVLISFGGNDAHTVRISDAEYVAAAMGSLRPWLYPFKLGQLAVASWERFATGQAPGDDADLVFRVSPEEYTANLTRMIELSRAHGATCVLLTRPFTGESPDATWWKNFAPQYVDATLQLGETLDVPVIDVHAHFADTPEYFEDESHFTEAGHHVAAALVAETVLPLIQER